MSAIWLSVLVGGCSGVIYDHYSAEDDPEDQDLVTLVLNIGLVSPTRGAADNDRELMHSLRIILLDAETDGQVEYNAHIDFTTGTDSFGYHFIRTKPGKKKIFLIANEESIASVNGDRNTITTLLDELEAQEDDGLRGMSSVDAEKTLKAVWFTPGNYDGANGWIPLSSSYAFEIKESELTADNRRVEKTFYLVHAATKFEFEFLNYRTSLVTINSLSISSISDNMYLMAKFEGTLAEEKMGPAPYNNLYWIDWLKKVSDETTDSPTLPGNKSVNELYGWIREYDLPSSAHFPRNIVVDSNPSYSVSAVRGDGVTPGRLEGGDSESILIYCPESKYGVDEKGDQKYTFSVSLTDANKSSSEPQEFTFENLKTLFRNTHVIVIVTLGENGTVNITYTVCPWDEKATAIDFY